VVLQVPDFGNFSPWKILFKLMISIVLGKSLKLNLNNSDMTNKQ
jgi:hypothetical protein